MTKKYRLYAACGDFPFIQLLNSRGYVESLSLDNGNYSSQEQYEAQIDDILANLKAGKGRVVSLYSHAIGAGDWSITEDRLLYLLRKAKEMGLQFYTFQELQNW